MTEDELFEDVMYWKGRADAAKAGLAEWVAYADKLEAALELVCGKSRDDLTKMHAEQGLRLRLVRPASSLADCGGANE